MAEQQQERSYIVVCDCGTQDFNAAVADKLTEGWECQGGVSVLMVGDDVYYHQAMVKNAPRLNSGQLAPDVR